MRRLFILLCPLLYFFLVSKALSQSPIQPTSGPYPVTAKQFAFKPGGIVFLGTEDKGVLRSTDYGNSWKNVSNGLNNAYGTECLAVGPEGNLYAGYQFGLFRSTNNGDTWTSAASGLTYGANCIAADPANGNIYVGAFDGVYKSTDKGNSWFKVHNENSIMAIVIDTVGHHIYAGGAYGVYVSDNDGKSWYKTDKYNGDQITTLAVDSKCVLYIGDFMGGLFKSNDKGMTCFPVINDIGLASTVSTIAINSDDYVYIGTWGYGIYYSTDNGGNWAKIKNGLRTQSMQNISISPEGYMYAGARFGCIYRSTDKGKNWEQLQLSKLPADDFQTPIYNLMVNSQGDIFALADDLGNAFGIYRSTDKGKTWFECVNNLNYIGMQAITFDGQGNLFVSSEHGFFKSTDKGDSWIAIVSETLPEFNKMFSNSKGDIFGLTRFNELYKSTDNGKKWVWVNHDFGPDDIRSFVITPNDHMFIASSGDKGIYRSIDSGASWQKVNNGLGPENSQYAHILVSDPKGQLFAGTFGPDYCYRSTDDGETWTKINKNIESTTVYAIGSNGKGKVFLCGSQDLFVSENNGDNWTRIENPEANLSMQTVAFHPDGQAFFGTGRGVYKFVDSLLTSVSITNTIRPGVYSLEQNYPNPFNPTTTINFSIPENVNVKVAIYNILGKEVRRLASEELTAGNYSVKFDGRDDFGRMLSSGIYFYRIDAGKFSASHKMVLMK